MEMPHDELVIAADVEEAGAGRVVRLEDGEWKGEDGEAEVGWV